MLTNNDYYDAEPRSLCEICSEAVTNPLCPKCLTIQVEAWLTLYPNLKKELMPRLRKHLKESDPELEATPCIKCNDLMSVCPYCFTEKVLEELKKIHAHKIILLEFLRFFNFDHEYEGYFKETGESLENR
jgi:hypothetical protein